MKSYLIIILADILLATEFVFQKQYQRRQGTTITAGLTYNALLGLITAVIFLAFSKFRLEFSVYSIIMATMMSLLAFCYSLIGFRILEVGNMALYTQFLMTGGMTVPYVLGILFLEEQFTFLRSIGLLFIIAAVIISNTGSGRTNKKQIGYCVAVFVLNGLVSVVSKLHQIDTIHGAVSSQNFVFLTGLTRFVLCSAALFCVKRERKEKTAFPSLKRVLPIIAAAAAVNSLSYLCQLIGAKEVPATVLYPLITGGSIILSGLAGMLIFREKPTIRQWLGIGVCVIGICLFL